jgi:hypothetical protein
MNSLIVLLIFLIIFLSSYLIYRNYQDYNVLEKFSTQSSLSTYFQNNIDSDDYQKNINSFHVKDNKWNGIWRDNDNNVNAQFLEVNDKVIIVLSNSDITNIDLSGNSPECTNLFIGIGNLNHNKNIFIVAKVICNSYQNNILRIGSDSGLCFSGEIKHIDKIPNNSTIMLYPCELGNNVNKITLSLYKRFEGYTEENYPRLSGYLNKIAPFIQENPIISGDDVFKYTDKVCPTNTTPCKDTKSGYNDLTYEIDGKEYNACCNKDNNRTTNCFYNMEFTGSGNVPSIPKCPNTPTLNYYNNYSSSFYLQGTNGGNSLNICDYLDFFTNTPGNVAILCYVTNLKNVQTLSYQFFGVKEGENALTTQYDIMNSKLNSKDGSLDNYRNGFNIFKGVSMTNCIEESNKNNAVETILECVSNLDNDIKKNIPPNNINNTILPTIWEINSGQTYNLVNSCPFTLNTSILYNTKSTPIKYIECNDDGNINMSVNNGGNNQNLYMRDIAVLNTGLPNSNNYYAIATNIVSNKGLYLIPEDNVSGFYNNSTVVNLSNTPNLNGKWLILGFTLNKLGDLKDIIDTYTF